MTGIIAAPLTATMMTTAYQILAVVLFVPCVYLLYRIARLVFAVIVKLGKTVCIAAALWFAAAMAFGVMINF